MISPRANEVQAVVDILESDEHEDSAAMAKAIVKALGALLQQRDTFAVGVGLPGEGGFTVGHAPFWSVGDAKKFAQAKSERGVNAKVVPLYAAELAPEQEAGAQRCKCGHPKELHGVAMTAGMSGTGKPKPMSSIGCAVYHRWTKQKCDCTTYEKG